MSAPKTETIQVAVSKRFKAEIEKYAASESISVEALILRGLARVTGLVQ